jgi:hypothetical protein
MNQDLENVTNEPAEETTPVVIPTEIVSEETISTIIPVVTPTAFTEPIAQENDPIETVTAEPTSELAEEESELESVEELPDYALLNKSDLLQAALKASTDKELSEALLVFKAIKPYLDQTIAEEKAEALAKYLEEGGDKDAFEYRGDTTKEEFNTAFIALKQRKEDVRKRQEAEKQENLLKKEAILEEIKKLNESEETANSLKRIKELQAEWKTIKNVPKERIDNLWESYRVLNEIFYDRLSINNELKDLDRSKNLDHKIDLISKVSELMQEDNIKKVLINVKKHQEEWRFIGPVAREASDDIWNRFKLEVDKVYEKVKAKTDELEEVRKQNLIAKQELLVKAKELASIKTLRVKEWMDNSNTLNELMDSWKKIGHVPMSVREEVWNEFREARNTFYANKNVFFKAMHSERNANLKAKEDLCEKAEAIAANPIDWNKQTEELKKMQEAWKKIGHAPDKVNDAVWRRFRTACDGFFAKKSERYAGQIIEQTENLNQKLAIINKLEELSNADNTQNIFADLKQIQTDWNAIGFVPAAKKDVTNKQYNDLLDKLYGKHKQLNKEMREDRDKQNFELLATSPNGMQKLQREEKILMERIRGMKKDIETWDNNLGFFKSGNSKNPLAEQIQSKIEIANKHIAGLEEKLKALKVLKNKSTEAQ